MDGFARKSLMAVLAVASVTALVVAAALARRNRTRERRGRSENARLLAATMPNMMWAATPQGAMDYCNRRFSEFTGTSPGAR